MTGHVDAWLRPHIAAVVASVRAGFRFRYLPHVDDVLAVQGFRVWSGAMDVYLARSANDALAARFRLSDLESESPAALWHRYGAVAEVVSELVELPANGSTGAPRSAGVRVPELWVPAGSLA